jgi:hypothetical protein
MNGINTMCEWTLLCKEKRTRSKRGLKNSAHRNNAKIVKLFSRVDLAFSAGDDGSNFTPAEESRCTSAPEVRTPFATEASVVGFAGSGFMKVISLRFLPVAKVRPASTPNPLRVPGFQALADRGHVGDAAKASHSM